MEIKEFDRRFHKTVFFNRLGIGIYSIAFPIIIIVAFSLLNRFTDIEIATDVFMPLYLLYILGFIIYSILLIILDKRVKYDQNKINVKYKTGFIVSKVLSYIQFLISNSVLVIILIIGAIGSSLNAGSQFEIGNHYNEEPEYICSLQEYDEYYGHYQFTSKENIVEFVYTYTTAHKNFYTCEFYTTYVKYNNSLDYSEFKNELFFNKNILSHPFATKKGRYVLPVTNLNIEGYTLYVIEGNSLDTLTIIGYNNEDYGIVILETNGATFDHFGKDLTVAEQAFKEYVISFYYLPWCENENNEI